MTNYEKIHEAWRIGWAAVMWCGTGGGYYVVVSIRPNQILLRDRYENVQTIDNFIINEEFIIKGFIYAGELAGNEEPREGQKFRSKSTGNIFVWVGGKKDNELYLHGDDDYSGFFEKIQVEPYFE